jgi:LysM repeat protein/Tfp pilus assembly protein PilZ
MPSKIIWQNLPSVTTYFGNDINYVDTLKCLENCHRGYQKGLRMVKTSGAHDKGNHRVEMEKKWDRRGAVFTTQEMRQHPRATFDWPLTIDRNGETISGRIVNISRGGALINVPVEFHPKEQFRMAIDIPEHDDAISVKGVVIRTSPSHTDNGQPSFSSGIIFTEITKEDLRYFTGNLAPEWSKDYREQVDWPLTIDRNGGTISGRIVNISRGGALINVPVEFHPKEQFRMAIEIPEHDDVILVKGEVVRTSPSHTDKGQPSFSSGIMFTEIIKEDLRYFTGNQAPEWSKNYREQVTPHFRPARVAITESRRQNSPWKPIAIGLAVVSVVALFFTLQKTLSNQHDTERIAALEERLHLLELKKTPDDIGDSLVRELNNQIATLNNQRNYLTENSLKTAMQPESKVIHPLPPSESLNTSHPTGSTTTPIQLPTSDAKPATDIAQALPPETGVHIQPQVTIEERPTNNRYYVVQRGQNLYRISLVSQLSVEELRKLNRLKPGEAIYPGQRLLISKAAEQPLLKDQQ